MIRQVKVILDLLNAMPAPEGRAVHGPFDRSAKLWSTRLMVASAVLFGVLVLLGAVHGIAPLPRFALIAALGVGIAVQLLALASLLLHVASGVVAAAVQYRHIDRTWQEEFAHDHERAARLASHPLEALEAADRWVEQKIKRLERRQLRFFGGPDKLTLAALMVGSWNTWKELGAAVVSWQPSPLLFGAALLVGLAIGGIAVARLIDRLAYHRDVLQIAKALHCVFSDGRDCAVLGSGVAAPPAGVHREASTLQ